jgi:hypothetical protein
LRLLGQTRVVGAQRNEIHQAKSFHERMPEMMHA